MNPEWKDPSIELPERLTLVIGIYLDFPLCGEERLASVAQSDHYFITYLENPPDDRWYSHSYSGNAPIKPPDYWKPLRVYRPYLFERKS